MYLETDSFVMFCVYITKHVGFFPDITGKVLARDPSNHLYDGPITPWTGKIDEFNRCDILKIVIEKIYEFKSVQFA